MRLEGLVQRPHLLQAPLLTGRHQELGSEWILGLRSLALRVPSAVVLSEFNLPLNPAAPRCLRELRGLQEGNSVLYDTCGGWAGRVG